MLKGKTVVLGVTGGIAAYKIPNLASLLVKEHADVHVILTQNAREIVSPIPFESLTKNRCLTDTFDRGFTMDTKHVSLADRADVLMIAPATANTIAKLAHGIGDNMLTTTALACTCTKIIAPAMNTKMWENPVTQDNLNILRRYGWLVIDPIGGRLACGAVGLGKMPEPSTLLEYLERELFPKKDLTGQRVLVTAGPTQEAIDPVRYITNHSSGKMGYSLARMAMLRGAQVTLVTGVTALTPPPFVEVIKVVSAQDMFDAVTSRADSIDIIIKAAAVADYRPTVVATDKIKKSDDSAAIPLERTKDILAALGAQKRKHQFLCGFSMETKDMLENSRRKLEKKHLDMIVANNLRVEGAGFGVDTNVLTVITPEGHEELPLATKDEAANAVLDRIAARMDGACSAK